jgi:hypothetical protein
MNKTPTLTCLYHKLWFTNNLQRETNMLPSLQITNQIVGCKHTLHLTSEVWNTVSGIYSDTSTLPETTCSMKFSAKNVINLSICMHITGASWNLSVPDFALVPLVCHPCLRLYEERRSVSFHVYHFQFTLLSSVSTECKCYSTELIVTC